MDGRAVAPAAGTVLNALATGRGAAMAIDLETTATVDLTTDGDIRGEIGGEAEAETDLIERCVARVLERYGDAAGVDPETTGGRVRTESEIPMAAGLKSSSAAANATVLATLDALGVVDEVERLTACRLGVDAAREAGVTVTGAFDDASASMLGGVTITDNERDELLARAPIDWDALVYTPPERAYSADADVDACEAVGPLAELVEELALEGRFGTAMTVNGFAFCGALGFPTDPLLEALPAADGVSLSGTGPSYVAVGTPDALDAVEREWAPRPGTTRRTATRTEGATVP